MVSFNKCGFIPHNQTVSKLSSYQFSGFFVWRHDTSRRLLSTAFHEARIKSSPHEKQQTNRTKTQESKQRDAKAAEPDRFKKLPYAILFAEQIVGKQLTYLVCRREAKT
jgi:hypothetical protein